MTGRAIVSGGSIGGLFAAVALIRAGWTVDIFERTRVELSGRGAGIVTHAELIDALDQVGADTSQLGVAVEDRVAYDLTGKEVLRMRYPQVVTSWDRIHQALRRLIPDSALHLGRTVAGYEETPREVVVRLTDGTVAAADILVGADGFRSAVRARMQPAVVPEFSGYVVWRAVTDEARLSAAVHRDVFPYFGLFAPHGTQIIGYPIAGPGNDLRPGHRRYNFVWYAAVDQAALGNMLTDAAGTYHPISIPPPSVRKEVLAAMEADARDRLPPPFVEVLEQSDQPFFTPIYDHCAPHFAEGRVALSGDAACVARPHVGMGVTKAARDALALGRHLGTGGDVAKALSAYSAERQPRSMAAHLHARRLGGFIFDGDGAGNADGRGNGWLETIMRDTAVPVE